MTSALKFGVLGLGAVGIGIGAYLVNLGVKGNNAPTTPTTPVASANNPENPAAEAGQESLQAPSLQPVLPEQDAASGSLASTEANTDRAASPAPLGVGDAADDTERSWRPRPLETSEAYIPPIPREEVLSDLAQTATPAESTSAVDTPTLAPVMPSSVTEIGTARMALREQPTTTQPADAGRAGETVARVPETAQPAAENMIIHVVEPGDTFSALAVKYLGGARYVKRIAEANPKIDPNRLYVGTKLKIPVAPEQPKAGETAGTAQPVASIVSVAAARPQTAPPPVDPARAYTIKPGDSWSALARQFLGNGNEWTRLYEYNKERFPNSRTLHPGMVIEIPPR